VKIAPRPYIIAEVGSNWTTLNGCYESIRLARLAGANAVKFQLYTHEALYGFKGDIKGVLPQEWLPELLRESKIHGIDFMCSAFSPELVRVVDPFVNAHKIASSEACHIEILTAARALQKPIIISFGGHTDADIERVLSFVGPMAIPLYCVPDYPAKTVDFKRFTYLKEKFSSWDWGYSDHTQDAIEIPRRAAELGAVVIEKHVNFVSAQGPDSGHSLNFEEFRMMVKAVRGEPYTPPRSDGELQMILRHKRRVVARREIVAGEEIDPTNSGIYRVKQDDAHGAHPFQYNKVLGLVAKHYIPRGWGISMTDVE
jgi:pseudaminic acid synthase